MKTTNIYIIVLALLLSVSVQAQTMSTSKGNGVFDGLANTFHDVKDDVIETVSKVKDKLNDVKDKNKENIEKLEFALKFRKGDIRLIMKADKVEWKNITDSDRTSHEGFYYRELGDNTLKVMFDWDNRALKMEGETTGSEFGSYLNIKDYGDFDKIIDKKDSKKIVQYTDKDGNWYTPVEDMEQPYEEYKYIKFNAKQMAVEKLNEMLDFSIEKKTDTLALILMGYASKIDFEHIYNTVPPENYLKTLLLPFASEVSTGALFEGGIELNNELQKNLKEAIRAILSKELEEIGGFPIFIHWAFKWSPEVIQAYYGNKVNKKTFDCEGFAKACSKFTVLQGPDKGKSMEFDRLGRLTFINSLEEGTAQFFYDKDITVTLPDPNVVMDMTNGVFNMFDIANKNNAKKERERERNMWENYRKKMEEEEAENKKELEKVEDEFLILNDLKEEELLNLREEEMAEALEQQEEANSKEEREEAEQKLEELKEVINKEIEEAKQEIEELKQDIKTKETEKTEAKSEELKEVINKEIEEVEQQKKELTKKVVRLNNLL